MSVWLRDVSHVYGDGCRAFVFDVVGRYGKTKERSQICVTATGKNVAMGQCIGGTNHADFDIWRSAHRQEIYRGDANALLRAIQRLIRLRQMINRGNAKHRNECNQYGNPSPTLSKANVAITGGGTPYRAWAGWHSLSSMRQLDGCEAVQADPGFCRFNREFAMNIRGNSDHELSTESPVGECLGNGFS